MNQITPDKAHKPSKLSYPVRMSEFEYHANLYHEMLRSGMIVRGEVKYRPDTGRGARFDLVVYDKDRNAVAVVEVKNHSSGVMPKKTAYYAKITGLTQAVYYPSIEIGYFISHLKRAISGHDFDSSFIVKPKS